MTLSEIEKELKKYENKLYRRHMPCTTMWMCTVDCHENEQLACMEIQKDYFLQMRSGFFVLFIFLWKTSTKWINFPYVITGKKDTLYSSTSELNKFWCSESLNII